MGKTQIFSGSIDVTKIDKTKLISKNKNGEPFKNGGVFLNVQVVVNDERDSYENNGYISINQQKEEREAGEPKVYLGNVKKVWEGQNQNTASNSPSSQSTEEPLPNGLPDNKEDDLPF